MSSSRPYTSSNSFVLDGVNFHRYSAMDAHGTRIDCFYVDGCMVGYHHFMSRIRDSMEKTGMLREMLMANGANTIYRPEWNQETTNPIQESRSLG